jgi:hypothetical protein
VSTHTTLPPKPIPQRRHLDNHVRSLPKPRHVWQGKGKVICNSRLKSQIIDGKTSSSQALNAKKM